MSNYTRPSLKEGNWKTIYPVFDVQLIFLKKYFSRKQFDPFAFWIQGNKNKIKLSALKYLKSSFICEKKTAVYMHIIILIDVFHFFFFFIVATYVDTHYFESKRIINGRWLINACSKSEKMIYINNDLFLLRTTCIWRLKPEVQMHVLILVHELE